MNVFDLDQSLVGDYERFARSFTRIRAPDIHRQVEKIYASNRFWPDPLISINPHFEAGSSISELVAEGSLLLGVKRTSRSRSVMSAFDGEFNRSLQHTARSQLAGGFKAQGLARVLMNHRANLAGYA